MCDIPACIYCGVTTDLSESDVIPDALTNARITNRNVCKTEHNNKFSDLFESKVIKDLAFITNELDIKSKKSKNYASYDALVNIDGVEYDVSKTSDKSIFNGRVLTSKDKKYKMSTVDRLKKIVKNPEEIEFVDINSQMISQTISIDTKLFFSVEIFRMVAKIAYEWYCAKNNVSGYHQEFANIVAYITKEEGFCLVTIIQEQGMYDLLEKEIDLGSHCLFCFKDNQGRINIVCSLFGIVMYRIIVAETVPEFCHNNFMYIELRTDSSRKEIVKESRESAENYFYGELLNNMSGEEHIIGGMRVCVRTGKEDASMMKYMFVLNMAKCFNGIWTDIVEPNEAIRRILFHNINNITKASLLHKKSIKRFVNEYFGEGHETVIINPSSSDKKSIFNLYILYFIGKSEIEVIDDNSFGPMSRKSTS